MQKTEYFYRKYKTSSFEKSEKRKSLCFVIPKDKYHEKPLLWNEKTFQFDQIESAKEAELCSSQENCVVEFPEYEEIKKETFSAGTVFSSAFKNICEINNSDAHILTEAAAKFTSENFASFALYNYKRKKNNYYEFRKNDENKIPRKIFAYKFETDYKKLTLKFSIFSIIINPHVLADLKNKALLDLPQQSSPLYSEEFYLFDFGNGLIKRSAEPLKFIEKNKNGKNAFLEEAAYLANQFLNDYNGFQTEKIPPEILQHILDVASELANIFTGRQISVPPKLKNPLAYDALEAISHHLLSLVFLPFSQMLSNNLLFASYLLKNDVLNNFQINRKDPEIFNHFMDFAKLPNIKSVRKACSKSEGAITVLHLLKKASFTDLNCYNLAMESKKFFDIFFGNYLKDELFTGDDEDFVNLKFFFDYARKTRSEISIMKTLLKIGKNESASTYTDALNMFRIYFDYIPEVLKKRVLRYGFNEKNHDELSLLCASLKNVPFKYSDEQRSLEQKIEDYEFALPKDSTQLVEIGMKLHNCVASYSDRVLGQKCTIVYAKKNDKYVLCIEVRGKKVHQERANLNRDPSKEQDRILKIWRDAHELDFTENEY